MSEDLTPLILDMFEPIADLYDANGEQVRYDKTTHGTADDVDSSGYD